MPVSAWPEKCTSRCANGEVVLVALERPANPPAPMGILVRAGLIRGDPARSRSQPGRRSRSGGRRIRHDLATSNFRSGKRHTDRVSPVGREHWPVGRMEGHALSTPALIDSSQNANACRGRTDAGANALVDHPSIPRCFGYPKVPDAYACGPLVLCQRLILGLCATGSASDLWNSCLDRSATKNTGRASGTLNSSCDNALAYSGTAKLRNKVFCPRPTGSSAVIGSREFNPRRFFAVTSPMSYWADKVAVITGGSGGLGKARRRGACAARIADCFGRANRRVAGVRRRSA